MTDTIEPNTIELNTIEPNTIEPNTVGEHPAPHAVDLDELIAQRRQRLQDVMRTADVPALLTADPFSIRYATGTRNMLVHGLTGPDRLALVVLDGPTILWEFAGCEHLAVGSAGVDEVRLVPSLSAKKSEMFLDEVAEFGREIREIADRLLPSRGHGDRRIAIERLDSPVVDALRANGIDVGDATAPMQQAMAIKQPAEIAAMRAAMAMTQAAASELEAAIRPGRTEQEVWAEFHRGLIAEGGELVVARLLQAGVRTFPYFQEASAHVMRAGDLVCFDSDAVGLHGYSVDFSRTFLCGDGDATQRQRELYALALEQLRHNSANLAPGRSFLEFASRAFDVPEPHRQYGYYQLAHGLGLAGGHPNVPRIGEGAYPLSGDIEPGMVICVESYIGDPDSMQGVKLEDQYLITDEGVEPMSTYPFDAALLT